VGGTGEGEKEVLLLPSLSGWLDKGEMSEEIFSDCPWEEKEGTALTRSGGKGYFLVLTAQILSQALGHRAHLTSQDRRHQRDQARACCCWKRSP